MKKLAKLILISQLLLATAWAQSSFVIKNIRVLGLRNISVDTVESYLPVKRGELLQPEQTSAIIRSLYKTGFFRRISLEEEGGTLIINVVERPTIGELKIKGNSIIPTDKLTSVMKTLDVAEGRVYNEAVIDKIKQSLLNQYYQQGRYNARITITATQMSRNRVAVNVDISEGLIAKIAHISIIGNHAFSQSVLNKQLTVAPQGLLTYVTHEDQYSESRLEASAEMLRNYYMDRGYLHAQVKSSQAQISPDHKHVYITFVVTEGDLYTIEKVNIEGNTIVPVSDLEKLVVVHPGDTFSRQKILDTEKLISQYYGNQGYLFSTVGVRPGVNEALHKVMITFDVNAGKRTYVRHINFVDNNKTNDVTLRREMVQMEGAPASNGRLEESKHRLSLQPFIKNVEMSVVPVPQVDDQVDVNYKITEESTSTASLQLGYSLEYRAMIGLQFNQKNFLGTGNTLGVNLNKSKYNSIYALDFTDPYYTPDGISRSISFSFSKNDPTGASASSTYITNEYDVGMFYSIPLNGDMNSFNRIIAGGAYQNSLVNLRRNSKTDVIYTQPNQINTFIERHGRHFQEFDMRVGFTHNSLDRAIFPTQGSLQSLMLDVYAPLATDSLAFYSIYYSGRWYQPLISQFILQSKLNLGYGNGFTGIANYPFYKNYFAGGIDSVRGFSGATLGPLDSLGNPFGGNMVSTATLALILPNFISDNIRTSLFVDAGNVYTSFNNREYGGESTMSGPLRYSVGVEMDVIVPALGPLQLTVARGLPRAHDRLQFFQFALGANF